MAGADEETESRAARGKGKGDRESRGGSATIHFLSSSTACLLCCTGRRRRARALATQ